MQEFSKEWLSQSAVHDVSGKGALIAAHEQRLADSGEWIKPTYTGPKCYKCGRHEPNASPDATKVLCSICCARIPEVKGLTIVKRQCSKCGGAVEGRSKVCKTCKRQATRARVKRHRLQSVTL